MLRSSLQLMWDLTIHLPWGSSVLAGTPPDIWLPNTICNSPSPPLADIVRFGPLRIVVNFTVTKLVY